MTRQRRRGLQAIAGVFSAALVAALAIPSTASAASGGTLLAWGDSRPGQLGDGKTATSNIPVKVKLPPGTKITSVRAGCAFFLALTSAGRVLAWGHNDSGQLGDGSVQDKAIPVLVHLPSGVKVTAIRAGCTTGFALTSAGRVLAWGNNGNGELGIGSTTDMPTPVPVRLPAGTKVKAISAGETFGLALTRSGRVWAWGNNPDGELGNGTTAQSDIPVLVTLPAGVTVTGLAAGSAHSMALTSAGQVLSWGRNNSGQLGDGTTDNSHIPVMTTLPSGTRVRNFFAGCEDSLVRTASGRLLAWGANGSGQLGDGTTTSRSLPVAVRLPKGVRVTNISAGCLHNLAVTADGGVLAWGVNNAGQLGDGTTAPIRRTPVHVRIPAGLSVIAIGSGQTSSASLAIVH